MPREKKKEKKMEFDFCERKMWKIKRMDGKENNRIFFFLRTVTEIIFFEITMIELKIIIKFPILNNNKVD